MLRSKHNKFPDHTLNIYHDTMKMTKKCNTKQIKLIYAYLLALMFGF